MGEVFVVFRVSLDNPEDLEKVKAKIQDEFSPKEIREENIGFGIKVLKVLLITKDEGGFSELEEKLSQIEGISSVDVEDMGRL